MAAEADAEPGSRGKTVAEHRRSLILGAGGAGKSRLARQMAEVLGVPIIHLDRHFWNPGWVETERKEWASTVVELSSGDAWVMDGNYGGTISLRLPRAEAVVLLDPPVWQCIWGIYERSTIRRAQARPDLAEGCEEQLPDWDFFRFVLTYKWRSRGRVLGKIAAEPHVELYHLKSRRAAHRFLAALRAAVRTHSGRDAT